MRQIANLLPRHTAGVVDMISFEAGTRVEGFNAKATASCMNTEKPVFSGAPGGRAVGEAGADGKLVEALAAVFGRPYVGIENSFFQSSTIVCINARRAEHR